MRESDGSLTPDWGADKIIIPNSLIQDDVLFIDSWNYAGFYENAFYTKPFQGVLLPGEHARLKTTAPEPVTHIFKVKAPLLAANETVCMVGDHDALHNWNADDPILLDHVPGQNFFTAQLNLSQSCVFRLLTNTASMTRRRSNWFVSRMANRERCKIQSRQIKKPFVNDGFVILPANTWKGAGVAIPVFSLRSAGEFWRGRVL